MIIASMEPVGKNRVKIHTDEQLTFVLYKGELSRYRLKLDKEIPEETLQVILKELLPKRAKLRCMNILKTLDKTEYQLRQKLKEGGYPEDIIEEAISYVKGFHYIDDVRYARMYMESRAGKKSFRQMQQDLMQKGVSKEDISEADAQRDGMDEEEVIRKLAEKKHMDPDEPDYKIRQKNYAYFARKGFSSSAIRNVLQSDTFT